MSIVIAQREIILRICIALLGRLAVPLRGERVILRNAELTLGVDVRQLKLWEADPERSRRLMSAIDELRDRYGDHVIRRGEP